MISNEKIENQNNPQRAPRNREAPVPLIGPSRRRRAPTQPQQSKLNELFKDRKALQFQNTGFQGGPSRRRKGYRLALWSWMAAFVDALILLSMSCVFLVCFSMLMKAPVGALLKGLFHTEYRILFYVEVFAVCSWIYMVTMRVFMGASIGEWACDLRLGNPHERFESIYVLRVLLRATLILATGVVTLPLLSLLFGKDVAGSISGLRLLSLK
ncbi:MAG: RDD family protein [Bdellovibrio sp.]|nr:RDD family protein [Bdellovibrio sp.]